MMSGENVNADVNINFDDYDLTKLKDENKKLKKKIRRMGGKNKKNR